MFLLFSLLVGIFGYTCSRLVSLCISLGTLGSVSFHLAGFLLGLLFVVLPISLFYIHSVWVAFAPCACMSPL